MLAEWDKEDGWKKLEHAIDVGSKWALFLAVGLIAARLLYVTLFIPR